MMANVIADRLRDYADQIDSGSMTPTKMLVLFDQPNIIGAAGFKSGEALNTAADKISEAWNELNGSGEPVAPCRKDPSVLGAAILGFVFAMLFVWAVLSVKVWP